MKTKTFNTGRPYAEDGQRISYMVIGKLIYFSDHSRMIDGVINCGDIPTTEVTPDEVMWHYDRNNYTQPTKEQMVVIHNLKYEPVGDDGDVGTPSYRRAVYGPDAD